MSKLFTSALFFISFAPLWLSVIFVDTVSLLEDTQSSGIEKIGISTILVVFSISLVFVLKKLRVEANSEAERYNTYCYRRKNGDIRIFTFIYFTIVCI